MLPCNMNDSPAMGKAPHAYIFSERGLKWLEPLLKCSQKQKEWKMKEGAARAKAWWKRQDKALAKLKKVVRDEEARV